MTNKADTADTVERIVAEMRLAAKAERERRYDMDQQITDADADEWASRLTALVPSGAAEALEGHVCTIIEHAEHGRILSWRQDWGDLPLGTRFYTTPPAAGVSHGEAVEGPSFDEWWATQVRPDSGWTTLERLAALAAWEHLKRRYAQPKEEEVPRKAADDMDEPRFFVEHGTIHDRLTGKHVTGDVVFGQSVVDESLAALNELHLALLIADEVLSCDPAYDDHYKLSKAAIRKALHGQTRDAQPEEPK